MKAKFLGLLAYAAIGIAAAGPSHAATLVGAPSNALGIDGLVVDGVTYNVVFEYAGYSSVFTTTSPPTFMGNETGAIEAADNLRAALSDFNVLTLDVVGSNTAYIPSSFLAGTPGFFGGAAISDITNEWQDILAADKPPQPVEPLLIRQS